MSNKNKFSKMALEMCFNYTSELFKAFEKQIEIKFEKNIKQGRGPKLSKGQIGIEFAVFRKERNRLQNEALKNLDELNSTSSS